MTGTVNSAEDQLGFDKFQLRSCSLVQCFLDSDFSGSKGTENVRFSSFFILFRCFKDLLDFFNRYRVFQTTP